ncbi:MAG: hypothetical protein LBC75_10265 [Fibromonadaceae bacterium]|nr:hypothetical protein [Fibromonadaceae bacterium]
MKKFFVPLFLALLLGCNDGFKSDIAASEQKNNRCYVENSGEFYKSISEKLCEEIGGEVGRFCPPEVCGNSSSDEESSSSMDNISSTSRPSSNSRSSSSSRPGNSSSGGTVSSSSDEESSSSDEESSSSSGAVNSSSSGTGSSSFSGTVSSSSSGTGSSSSLVNSSSSVGTSSSSSLAISSSSSAPPSLGACSAFPYYAVKTKKESIKNLVSNNGCGNVTYSVQSGGTYASITGDSISFANATASSTKRTINIRATAPQCETKDCPIEVVIVDAAYKDARCNHEDIFPVNLTITNTPTVIDYACCEPKRDYIITQCGQANFTLSIDGAVAVTSSNNSVNLPNLEPIPEPNEQCKKYGDSPGNILYRYPKRMLMTVTTNPFPTGGFSCNSW